MHMIYIKFCERLMYGIINFVFNNIGTIIFWFRNYNIHVDNPPKSNTNKKLVHGSIQKSLN